MCLIKPCTAQVLCWAAQAYLAGGRESRQKCVELCVAKLILVAEHPEQRYSE